MTHGGHRAGSGRKLGATTKKTREIAERAAEEGITPLEYMLELLRKPIPEDMDAAEKVAFTAMKFEAAKAAAPYIHPRLAAIEMKGQIGITHEQALDDLR